MTRKKNPVMERAWEWAMSDGRLVAPKIVPQRCQFCGLFHFGACEEASR